MIQALAVSHDWIVMVVQGYHDAIWIAGEPGCCTHRAVATLQLRDPSGWLQVAQAGANHATTHRRACH